MSIKEILQESPSEDVLLNNVKIKIAILHDIEWNCIFFLSNQERKLNVGQVHHLHSKRFMPQRSYWKLPESSVLNDHDQC